MRDETPAAESAVPRRDRLVVLDSLRGIAAMAVVLYHMTTSFDSPEFFPGYPKAIYSFSGGRFGVQLFFVISGFVILWTLGRARRWTDFGVSRFSRLYPPFWAALLFTVAWMLAVGAQDLGPEQFKITFPQFLANVTMVPQWLGFEPIDGVYWTLTIEMGFYIGIALMFVLGLTRRDRVAWVLGGAWFVDVIIGSALAKASGMRLHDIADYAYLFIGGMACFLLWEGRTKPRWLLWLLFLQLPFVDLLRTQFNVAMVDVAIVVVVQLAVMGKLRFLEWSPLVFLGGISYSLYLLHSNPGYLTQRWLLEQGVGRNLAVVLTVIQGILLAVVLNRLVEKKVSPWVRKRMSGSKLTAPAATPSPPGATR